MFADMEVVVMQRPGKVQLSDRELELYGEITFDPPDPYSSQAGELTESLLSRNAVPEVRLRWFTDPLLFPTGGKLSREGTFARNGSVGMDAYTHGAFLPILKYFICGPELPADVMNAFEAEVSSVPVVTGSTCDRLVKLAREATRQHRLMPHDACDEFWKLALECGVPDGHARRIRNAVLRVRTR